MASSDNAVVGAGVCLVSQIPSPTNMAAEAEIPARSYNKPALITFQKNMRVCVHTHAHTYVCARMCAYVGESERKRQWERSPSRHFGCSAGEDKVVWCLLTWPMIHNWGRTAVAGCTDRSQGGWQMIGPSGAKLSISPNVHCPLSAHLSFMSLPGPCKPGGHRPTICLTPAELFPQLSQCNRQQRIQRLARNNKHLWLGMLRWSLNKDWVIQYSN